jgi:hypothetical protein
MTVSITDTQHNNVLHYSDCYHAEGHIFSCHADCHLPECHYAEYHLAECRYAECHYAECCYAEYHGAQYCVKILALSYS